MGGGSLVARSGLVGTGGLSVGLACVGSCASVVLGSAAAVGVCLRMCLRGLCLNRLVVLCWCYDVWFGHRLLVVLFSLCVCDDWWDDDVFACGNACG